MDNVLQMNMMLLAEKAVQRAASAGVELDFTRASLARVDGIMAADWRTIPFGTAEEKSEVEGFIRQWGGYLGEIFRRERNGSWIFNRDLPTDRQVHVSLGRQAVYPLEQVRGWVNQRYTPATPIPPVIPTPNGTPRAESAPAPTMVFVPANFIEKYFHRPLKPIEWGGLAAAAVVALIILIWLISVISGAIGVASRNAYNARFAELIPQYLLPYQSGSAQSEPAEAGRILVVDLTARAIADWQYDLPSEVRATKPEDLGLLVQQECRSEAMNSSEGGVVVNEREVCRLAIIDLRNGHQIAERTFYGEDVTQQVSPDLNGTPQAPIAVAKIDRQTLVDWTVANYGQ